jgi:hypothetical protein
MSTFDIVIIAAVLLGGAVLIEGGHRVVIDAPAAANPGQHASAACPDNDNVPYSAACIAFLNGDAPGGSRSVR